jgi:hypothetical protein
MFFKCGAMADLPRSRSILNKMTSASGSKKSPEALPCLWALGEVVSRQNEKGRFRMLLQAIAMARLIFALYKLGFTEHPFIVPVYLTPELTAERYNVMKCTRSPMR